MEPPATPQDLQPITSKRVLGVIFAFVVLALLAAGSAYYYLETDRLRQEKYNELAAIGALKAGQIAHWHEERLADVTRPVQSPMFQRSMAAWLKDPENPGLREEWRQRLRLETEAFGYADAAILSTDGKILIAAKDDPDPPNPATHRAIAMALAKGQVALSDLYLCQPGIEHLDIVAPVLDEAGHPLAMLVLHADAEKFLFPLIQAWPTPSPSAETLLVCQDGDEVVFLNELRHRSGTTLSLRAPLTQADLPAVQAVLGKRGIFRGKDYRGVEVLADLRAIPGFPWCIIAKVDAAEILAELHYRTGIVVAFVLLGILLTGVAMAHAYRLRQADLYRKMFRMERDKHLSEARFNELFNSMVSGVAVYRTQDDGKDFIFVDLNRAGGRISQVSRDQVIGKSLLKLFPAVKEMGLFQALQAVWKTGQPQHLPVALYKDGRISQWVDNRIYKLPSGEVVAVYNDATELKLAQNRELLERQILELLNRTSGASGVTDAINHILELIKQHMGIEAVGIRLRQGDDFPYYSQSGFSEDFLETENTLAVRDRNGDVCRDANGNPSLECTCGLVLSGQTDPANPLFTPGGSCWTNDSPSLLKLEAEQDPRLHPRNRCIHDGYASVALIPLRSGGEIIGLLQLNDRRPNQFTLEIIRFLEGLGASIGIALGRKRAEEELNSNYALLQIAGETAHFGGWSVDLENNICTWSDAVADIHECPHGYAPPLKEGIDFYAPEWHEKITQVFSTCAKDGIPYDEDMEIITRKGKRVWVRAIGRAVRNMDGKIIKAQGAFQDITERKRAEAELRASEIRYRRLFESAKDGILILDAETGMVVDVNPYLIEMLGYSHEHFQGKTVWELGPFKDVIANRDKFLELQRRGYVRYEDLPLETADGQRREVEFVSNVYLADKKKVVHCDIRDITERKRAEAEREKLEGQLLQSQKLESVGRLAGGVAHDFNNMLSVIIGRAEMAMEKMDAADPNVENLKEVIAAGQRSADLTRQLLAFARKQVIAPKVLDLNDTVAGMLKMLRRLIGEDLDLLWKPAASLWPVKMDPAQIDQLLANLVVNARDAIAGVGKITIETEKVEIDTAYCAIHPDAAPGQYVMLAVSDDGCGMDEKVLSQIFEPFFTTKEVGKGTGLGLATVFGIVKQNQGFINVYSEPGKGTTFKLYLPRTDEEIASADGAQAAGEAPIGTETVLLVEDEESLLALAKMLLTELGYTVLAADSPTAALRLAKEYQGEIQLLMTDVVMPKMSGRDLLKQLAPTRPDIKCLFMSGYTANVIAHQGILDEGVNFLQKPFSQNALAQKVREALEG